MKKVSTGGAVMAMVVVMGLGLVMATTSCGTEATSPAPRNGDVGAIGLELQVAPGVTINTVNWAITNAATSFSRSGSVNAQFSNVLRFQLGGLPAAAGYSIALSAASTDGAFSCAGTASFTVAAAMTANVGITLTCNGAGNGTGTVVITGTTAVCGTITSISVLPLETTVNNPIALSATASAGATTPTFAWTATAGTFDNASSATPIFTCPSVAQDVVITLNVSSTAPECAATSSQSVTVTCDTLNPTFTNVYANVIGARCTSCHRPGAGGVTVGLLDLSTAAAAYANLVNVPGAGIGAGTSGLTCAALVPPMARVSPGSATASLLFNKVNAKLMARPAPCGSPMPTPATAVALTQAQVNLIQAWIDAGALNN
ncbi:MAG: hypothetical protein ABUS79_03345 [Pseudomonadota bacterium]